MKKFITLPKPVSGGNRFFLLRFGFLVLMFVGLSSGISRAQSIWNNPITGTNPNTSNPYTTGDVKDANITVSGIGRGTGITGSNANNRYSASAWSTTTLDANDYFYFTITPSSGYKIDFVSFVYTGQVSSGTPSVAFRSSVDSYTANIGTPNVSGTTISLSGAAYQGITSSITFRFYAYSLAASGTTFSINDFTFNATVSSTGNIAPTVTTQAPSSILSTTATGNGNITATGGVAPTARGFCWDLATNADPDINDTKAEETGTFSTGAFTGSISGLTAGTQYKVKAYATNSVGTSYGSVQTFTTLSSEPTSHATTFTATANSQTQIDLTFDAASTITNAAGYLILQRSAAAPTGAPADATTYTVGNSIGDGTIAAIITNTADVSKSITGLSAGTQYYFKIFPYSGSASTSNYKTDGSVPSANATTSAPLDATSKVEVPAVQIASGNISSTTTLSGSAFEVFKFKINDLGTTDVVATKVTQVKISKSSGTADWTDHIAGASLWDGVSQITTGTVVITDADITFPITSGNLDIANNSNKEITLKIWLNSTNIVDNSTMVFSVSQASHGFTADASASTFASDFGAAVTGNTITVTVEATKLTFVQQPTNIGTSSNITPAVTVSANDANNNRDLDYVTNITISATGLNGTPVSVTPVSGLATFSTLSFSSAATGVTLNASSGALTGSISNSFDVLLLPAAGEIVINQMSPDYSGASNEYIELVNKTNKSFDLSNLKIEYQSSGGSGGSAGGNLVGILGPYQYWLLSPDATITVGQTTSLTRDGSITAGFAAASAQIALRLKNSPNTIIDGIAYGTVSPNNLGEGTAAGSPPADGGLKRVSEGIDNNANSTDFTTVTQANIYLRNSNSVCISSNYTLPSNSYSADVVVSGSSPTVSLSGNTTISGKLLIQSGSLNVESNQNLTVTGTLTNNAGTAGILIKSNSSGTGTLLHAGTNINATVKQYLGSARNWYITPPVATVAAPSNNITRYYEYIEPGTNVPAENSDPSGATAYWKGYTPASLTLAAGKGYIAQTGAETTLSFSGALNNNSQYDLPLTRSNGVLKSGYNLVGNPYPAYLDWSLVIGDAANANVGTSVYFRTKNTGNAYTFSTHNGTSGQTVTGTANTTITKFIPPMQAFWVRVNNGTASTNLTLKKTMLAHRDDDGNKFKAPQVNTQPVLRLNISNGTNEDEALLYFNENAQNGFDNYDSPKMFNNSASVPEIYTTAGAEELVINGMNTYDYNTTIPLGLKVGETNTFTISASQVQNFDADTKIVLVDNATATQTNLTAGETYTFTSDATTSTTRFSVLFKSASGTTGLNNSTDNLKVYATDNKILVDYFSTNAANSSVSVYNGAGQKLYEQKLTGNKTTINKDFASGVYMVKLNNGATSISNKVIIK